MMNNLLLGTLAILIAAGTGASVQTGAGPEDLNDLEMAHVAVTANNTDIAYAHLALALSEDPDIRAFAETMIRDHSAVNEQVFALAQRLGVKAQDNEVSRELRANAQRTIDELSRLRGEAFDSRYATNEAGYHQAVNGLVENTFIPNIENAEVKAAFQGALRIFLVHQEHAERLASGYEVSASNVDVVRGVYDALAAGDAAAVLEGADLDARLTHVGWLQDAK